MDMEAEIKPTILLVDDEESILRSLQRSLRKVDAQVLSASSGEAAIWLLEQNQIAVIVCDQRMPEMSGSEVLSRFFEESPDTYRITLTGYTDLASAQKSINDGHVDQFLTKPWDDDHLRSIIQGGLDAYRLKAENRRLQEIERRQREELEVLNRELEARVEARTVELRNRNAELVELKSQVERTLRSVVRMLASTLELASPDLGLHAKRVAELAVQVGTAMQLSAAELGDLEVAAHLHDLGRLAENADAGDDGANSAAEVGAELLRRIDGFAAIADLVARQDERFEVRGEETPLLARIIAVASAFDQAAHDSSSLPRVNLGRLRLEDGAGTEFDPAVVTVVLDAVGGDEDDPDREIEVSPDNVHAGMILTRDLCKNNGVLLLKEGTVLTAPLIGRIRLMTKNDLLLSSVFVRLQPIEDKTT
ncbi:MAG: response regulator [Planctomycetes bacterium]|nr:response regulator [Planctomycetota bacterium]